MIKIYEAANGAEAKLILDLLTHANLKARIDGEYLQGGIGDLQASSLVRVMINGLDFEKGKTLIKQWENFELDITDSIETDNIIECEGSDNPPTNGYLSSADKKLNFLIVGVVGILIGVIFTIVYYRTPITENGIDYTGDSIPEEWWIYKGDRILEITIDRNLDKAIDLYYFYDHRGILQSMKSDDDFDGVFESESNFKNGNVLWTKMDTTGDGFKNHRLSFKYGVLDSISHYNSQTKKKVKVDYYKDLVLSYSETDTNNDENLDSKIEYDEYENPVKIVKIN